MRRLASRVFAPELAILAIFVVILALAVGHLSLLTPGAPDGDPEGPIDRTAVVCPKDIPRSDRHYPVLLDDGVHYQCVELREGRLVRTDHFPKPE